MKSITVAVVLLVVVGSGSLLAAGKAAPAGYELCGSKVRINCIVDGDTLWSNGVKIRIAEIDAPEIIHPRCAAEKNLGEQAAIRLLQLVNDGPFDIKPWHGRSTDKYGRQLRLLVRNGRSLGSILMEEGLARPWTGQRQFWC
ncbi:thermonuclease family protein [Aureimonas fodinaquatilis]|nr:thermonuclease family protein [Aureimonas fodinaquatilis]